MASLPAEVKLFTPRGSLYQVLDLRADDEAGSTETARGGSRRTSG